MAKQAAHELGQGLFPTDLPPLRWAEFPAEGFSRPVSGIIYRSDSELGLGMPPGGIDIEADGTLGYCTVFNSLFPHRHLTAPLLGLAVDGKVRTLTTERLGPVDRVDDIHYCGHYPVADLGRSVRDLRSVRE